MTEIWKDISGYEGLYQVSNMGNVKSLMHNNKCILKPQEYAVGYLSVNIYKNKKNKCFLIHRIVYESFIGQIPDNLTLDHINNNSKDNRLENLQLLTNRDNVSKHYATINKSSRFTGVCRWANRWQVNIRVNNKKIYIGRFISEVLAGLAYQKAKIKYGLF